MVSGLTRLIQRMQTSAKESIEYEYEYRDAEYEYEPNRMNPPSTKQSPLAYPNATVNSLQIRRLP